MTGIPERIAHDLRYGRRHACLFGGIEIEQTRNLRRPLPRGNDVLIVMETEREQ
jgi:hypothetical protein